VAPAGATISAEFAANFGHRNFVCNIGGGLTLKQ
jgi:hypothetical protein